ncbi:MAG: hypothetical protein K5773_09665 [Pseudobutyrivibrio sp.]|nr:hypothetical protein [Pseudobutyrivibrio sp.]
MISEFLHKYQEELITEKIQLKEDMDLLETKIKEESKFLEILESSNESYFKDFTPREVNAKNREKADEVRSKLENLNVEMADLSKKMKFYDGRLSEVKTLLFNKVSPPKESKLINYSNSSNESVENTNSDLVESLKDIKDTVLFDPYKASLELEDIINSLQK